MPPPPRPRATPRRGQCVVVRASARRVVVYCGGRRRVGGEAKAGAGRARQRRRRCCRARSRARGRAPKGKAWDRKLGQWVPMEGYNLDGTLIDGGAATAAAVGASVWRRRAGTEASEVAQGGRRRRQGTSASEGRAAAQRWGRRRRRRSAAAGELEGAEGRVRDQHPRESGGPRLPRGVVRGESRRHAARNPTAARFRRSLAAPHLRGAPRRPVPQPAAAPSSPCR